MVHAVDDGVSIQRRREGPARQPHLGHEPANRGSHGVPCLSGTQRRGTAVGRTAVGRTALGRTAVGRTAVAGVLPGLPDPVDQHAQQPGVVVQHFFVVRFRPVRGDTVAGKAAAEPVKQGRPHHGAQRPARQGRSPGGVFGGGMPQQELETGRGREFRGLPQTAVHRILGPHQGVRRQPGRLPPAAVRHGLKLDGGWRLWCLTRRDSHLPLWLCEGGGQGIRGPKKLVPAFLPGLSDGLQHLPEGGAAEAGAGRKIRSGVKCLPLRCEEDAHGPAALAA